MNNVLLPVDLTSLPPFRVLEADLGSTRALWLWWVVWRELAYLSQEGLMPGRLLGADKGGLVRTLGLEMAGHITSGRLALAAPEIGVPEAELWALLLRSRLLKADGEDWICARFANLHGAACQPRSQAQRGGDMRAFNSRQGKADAESFQQALLLSESKMKDEAGEPLDPDTRQRVTRLIVSCDNALYKTQRPTHAFSEGLVQDALRLLKRFSDEEINQVCQFVAARRNHPMLTTTEALLPRFGEIVGLLEGQA